jgi:hypothetical protein
MWKKSIRFIGRYLAIGVLVGIGFVAVEETYWQYFGNERVEKLQRSLNALMESFYMPGYKSFFDRLEEERPEALLSFSLESARLVDDGVQVTGTVTNAGPAIFNQFQIEVEAYKGDGEIIAECDEWMQTLEPGDEENVVMNCPFIAGETVTTLSEASFRIKRSLSTKQAVDPDPLRPTPYFVNGEIRGYRVYPGSDRSVFASLGLRPGDLVTEIDGQPLSQPEIASELFEKAISGQPAQFSVLRGDELKIIEIKVD